MQRTHSRAIRSMRTSTSLYSVPERPSSSTPESIYSVTSSRRSSDIRTPMSRSLVTPSNRDSLPAQPTSKSSQSERKGHSRTPSQLNSHLQHLFGTPQSSNQTESIDLLTETYGKLAWDPEELARSAVSSSGSSTRNNKRDLLPSQAARADIQSDNREMPGSRDRRSSMRSGSRKSGRRKVADHTPSGTPRKCEKEFQL